VDFPELETVLYRAQSRNCGIVGGLKVQLLGFSGNQCPEVAEVKRRDGYGKSAHLLLAIL
jgi:hypothetical protein